MVSVNLIGTSCTGICLEHQLSIFWLMRRGVTGRVDRYSAAQSLIFFFCYPEHKKSNSGEEFMKKNLIKDLCHFFIELHDWGHYGCGDDVCCDGHIGTLCVAWSGLGGTMASYTIIMMPTY